MDKQEFLNTLRNALCQEMSSGEAAVHLEYYNNYIDEQIRAGKREEEVLAMLGEPRLIARTILDAFSVSEGNYNQNQSYDERGAEGFGGGQQKTEVLANRGRRAVRILAGVAITLMILSLIVSILSFLIPIILPVVVILIIIGFIKKR